MFIDPLVYLALAPAWLVPLWARASMALALVRFGRRPAPMSGAEAAAAALGAAGVEGVAIVAIDGPLRDFYDPFHRTLRLSRRVHDGRSIGAVAVALREAGHAIRHAGRPWTTLARALARPTIGIGAEVAWMVVLAGFVLDWGECLVAGLIVLAALVATALALLPTEFDASRRAREATMGAFAEAEAALPAASRAMNLVLLAAIVPNPLGALRGKRA